VFSSLSESGFIPTLSTDLVSFGTKWSVLISFREWLHSYTRDVLEGYDTKFLEVLISFREWLHSYL